ncbi:Hypothetical protein GL50581_1197 [Giardia duodenalis ATCC 50581]|nr:Hypothetical protein GL50581_1197 [Giardia intestinalis ATCC 50581]
MTEPAMTPAEDLLPEENSSQWTFSGSVGDPIAKTTHCLQFFTPTSPLSAVVLLQLRHSP